MPFGIQQYVLRFQISISNTLLLMQEFKYQDNFSGIKARSIFIEAFRFPKIGKDFAARTIIELVQRVALVSSRSFKRMVKVK